MPSDKNQNPKQPKDLKDFELKELFDKYLAPCVSYLSPFGIMCLLIAFSPTVGAYIKSVNKKVKIEQIQSDMKSALDRFLAAESRPDVYGNLKDHYELDYHAMLTPKSDVQRLLACFQQDDRDLDFFDRDIIKYCKPILTKYKLTFEALFPKEFKEYKEGFSFVASLSKSGASGQYDVQHKESKTEENLLGFGVNLTKEAENLAEPPIFDRDQETALLEAFLLKHNRANVMLVGKNGTGKSAIVEGLAYNIAKGLSHPLLQGTQVISINLGDLMADTQFRGTLETKLKTMMETITENNYILFLDEIHTLFSHRAQEESIADIMKPYLTNGKIRIIGATTDKEFLTIRDGAFLRRFNQISISEPTSETTLDILRKIKSSYEKNYSISIPDEVLVDVVKKSKSFIHNRNFPDKAIDLLNYVCVLASNKDKSCNTEMVNKALVDMFNVPPALLEIEEFIHIATFHEKLNNYIFGQDAALSQIADTLVNSYIMHTDRTLEPQASFLFCGPSGVGKTKTAEAIAKLLGRELAVVNMNEYQHDVDINKLTGAAPGFAGCESGGRLTSIITNNPYSVILFDEIEKAHPNVQRLLLQILDKGTFTDSQGLTLKFSNTIIIMATNAGVKYNHSMGFNATDSHKPFVEDKILSKTFLPEFLGRINQIVTFDSLSPETLKRIVGTLCYELNASMKQEYNIGVSVSRKVQDFVIEQGYNPELGARKLKNTFRQSVEVPVAQTIINNYKMLTDKQKHAEIVVKMMKQRIKCDIQQR